MRLNITIVAAIAMAISQPATAADYSAQVQITVDNVYYSFASDFPPGNPTAIVTVVNQSSYTLRDIYVRCAFLKAGAALGTSIGRVANLSPGDIGTAEVISSERYIFDKVRCRVSGAKR